VGSPVVAKSTIRTGPLMRAASKAAPTSAAVAESCMDAAVGRRSSTTTGVPLPPV